MNTSVKDTIKKTYAEVVTQEDNGCCSCGPSCCTPENETFSDDYSQQAGYVADADYGMGCGIPTEVVEIEKGATVLDLGSGAGNDAFVARHHVGAEGKVIGLDFTPEMVAKARKNAEKLDYSNVEFVEGDIEAMPIESQSIDLVLSNCVMNLVPDKLKAYQEVYRVLKEGGRFSISDIVLPEAFNSDVLSDPKVVAACVGGAIEKNTYLDIIKEAGFDQVEILKEKRINYNAKGQSVQLLSITFQGIK